MAKLHHVLRAYRLRNPAARRARAAAGIKPGMEYWWVKMLRKGSKRGVTRYFREKPKPSQLTLSEYKRAYLKLVESVDHLLSDGVVVADAISDLETLAKLFESLEWEQRDKVASTPSSLERSSTADLLRSRAEQCRQAAEVVRDAAIDLTNSEYNRVIDCVLVRELSTSIPSPE